MSVYRSKATTLQQAVQAAMDTASWQESEHRRNPSTARARGVSVEQELTSDGEEHVARVGVNTAWTQQLMQVLQNLVDSEGKLAMERKATPRCFYCHRLGHVQKDFGRRKHLNYNRKTTSDNISSPECCRRRRRGDSHIVG